jgi:replicative DNA helicase
MKAIEKIKKIEDCLMGLLLRNPDLLLSEPFDIGIFKRWGKVIAVMITQINKGINPDVITITNELPNIDGLLFELGTLQKDSQGARENYKHLLNDLTTLQCDVEIYRKLNASVKAIENGATAKDVLSQLNILSANYANAAKPKYAYSIDEMMDSFKSHLSHVKKNKGKYQMFSGIANLDKNFGSFYPSNLIVVGARPAVGKTAWGLTVAVNLAEKGYRVGFISTEMSMLELAARFYSQISKIPAYKFRDANLSKSDWDSFDVHQNHISDLSLMVVDRTQMRVSDIAMQISAWKLLDGVDIVIVDYLTRLKPESENRSRHLEVGEIVTNLKNVARESKIPVIVLAQLNRSLTTRADKRPTMSDLRDSGIIEQEADSILLLDRDETACIYIDKNRHGASGMACTVEFDEQIMKWH